MIDALLFAVRDGIRSAGFGYGVAQCEIMEDGIPPPGAGNIFVAVYETTSQSTSVRNLDEYFSFALTLTMKVSVPAGRRGDQLLASKLARTSMNGQPSFNARMEQLRYLHENWSRVVMPNQTPPSANDNIAAWAPPGVTSVYGFIEPMRYSGRDKPALVDAGWFGGDPSVPDAGIKCEMRFERARRLQPQTLPSGPFV